jgi:hypothetical protein
MEANSNPKPKKREKTVFDNFSSMSMKETAVPAIISMLLIFLPGITLMIYSGLKSSFFIGGFVMLVMALTIIIRQLIDEKVVKKQAGFTDFQKIGVGIIAFLLISNIVSIGLLAFNPLPKENSGSKNAKAEEIASSYSSILLYYENKMGPMQDKLATSFETGDYAQTITTGKEMGALYQQQYERIISLCEKADSYYLNLENYEELSGLSLLCKNRDLLVKCSNEDVHKMVAYLEFIQKKNFSKEECDKIKLNMSGSETCNNYDKNAGYPVDIETNYPYLIKLCG